MQLRQQQPKRTTQRLRHSCAPNNGHTSGCSLDVPHTCKFRTLHLFVGDVQVFGATSWAPLLQFFPFPAGMDAQRTTHVVRVSTAQPCRAVAEVGILLPKCWTVRDSEADRTNPMDACGQDERKGAYMFSLVTW